MTAEFSINYAEEIYLNNLINTHFSEMFFKYDCIVQKHQIEIELLVISKRKICHLYWLKC